MSRYFIAIFLLFLSVSAVAAPRVVVTISPVHSLVAGVMSGIGQPELLLPPGASPHYYSLLPSDARRLADADVVIWIGGGLERFLQKSLQTLATNADVIEISGLAGITLLGPDEGDSGHSHGDVPDGHQHHLYDPHLWLDPENALRIVEAVSKKLSELDPVNADAYRLNAAIKSEQLQSLDLELRKALRPIRQVPFLVFHDAFSYLEHRYGLNSVGALTLNPERPPGGRAISAARVKVARLGVRCIFREPQFEPRLTEAVARGNNVKIGVLDPIGAAIPPGPDAYPQLMWDIANSLIDCLSE